MKAGLKSPLFIWLVALLARAAFVLVQTRFNLTSSSFYATDSPIYDRLAQSILSGQGLSINGLPTAFRPPAYPLFLAGCYWLFGRNFLLVGLVQSVLGALACVFVFKTARLIFNFEIAFLAGLLCALMPSLIIWTSGYILTEPLYIFLLTAALYCLVRLLPEDAGHEGERRAHHYVIYAACAGIALGLAVLTRPLALYFAGCAIIYLWSRTSWMKAALVASMVLLLLSFWALRNQRSMGRPLITTTSGGKTLYVYHNPQTTGGNGGYNPRFIRRVEAQGLSEVERDDFYKRAALEYALHNPGREVVLSLSRFWNMWRPAYAASSVRHRVVAWLTYVPLLCFSIPMVLLLRFRTPRVGLLCLFLLFHFLFHLLFAAELRFRIPLEPVLIIYAAAGAARAFKRLL